MNSPHRRSVDSPDSLTDANRALMQKFARLMQWKPSLEPPVSDQLRPVRYRFKLFISHSLIVKNYNLYAYKF